jgi:hypothetical protein
MLRRRGIPTVLFVGVRFSKDSSLLAHAWIRSIPETTNGNSENSMYVPLITIGQEFTIVELGPKSLE